MDFLNSQEKMNLEVSSEYLVLASELLEIKSRMLLPSSKNVSEEVEEDDPRSELVNRLLEYQAYKDITKVLHDREILRKDINHQKILKIILKRVKLFLVMLRWMI